ncbi:MAG TPA: S9 family peptidase [Anaerolineales bacterium]|nr:S9 family peptidase [Anaerolineales bacterium]
MKANIKREERHGWPSQPLPDHGRQPPAPWTLELLIGVSRIRHHALSPEGGRLAFVWDRDGGSDIWCMPTSPGAWPRRLTFDRPAQAYWADTQPRWSPDGTALAYVAEDEIWLVAANGGRAKKLTDHGHKSAWQIFSPDGSRLYFVSKRGTFANLCVTTPAGDWPIALTRFEADVSDPRPSPDGKTIAFVLSPQDDLDRSEICIVPSDGGEVRRLTGALRVWDLHPRWSLDGSGLAFISNRSGWRELYQLDTASGETIPLTAGRADVQSFSWGPDGKLIAYTIDRDGAGDLHLVNVDTRESRPLRSAEGWHAFPQWSPDGKCLFVGFESPLSPPELWRVDVESGAAEPLTCSMPPALEAASLRTPELVHYPSSGGASIPAFLFRPAASPSGRPCPAIVVPHGGPTSEYTLHWDLMTQWLVAKGYAVLAPNYRGSTGNGIAHQHALHNRWGLVDTDDMLAAADFLRGLPGLDGERLGIVGFSYGSYLALLALARDQAPSPRFKCGVCANGDSDILTSWAQGDRIGREDLERQMGHPSLNRAGYLAGSPVFDVEKIRRPLLIFHGDEDERVHPQQSEELVEALERAGKTFEYYVYGGEEHGILQDANQIHFYATLERFLDWYLM